MVVLVLFVLANFFIVSGSASGDSLSEVIPAESLFCVRVNNLQTSIGQLDQFLMGASPMPMGAAMLVRMQLAGALGDPMLGNVDMEGSFAVFAVSSEEAGPDIFIAGIIPVTDFTKFTQENSNCSSADAEGICKITSAGMDGMEKVLLLTGAGNFAIVTSEDKYEQLASFAKSISSAGYKNFESNLDTSQAKQSSNKAAWAYVNIKQLNKIFGPLATESLDKVIDSMQTNMPNQPGAPGTAQLTKMMEIYKNMAQAFLTQTESLTIALEPTPELLKAHYEMTAVDGTEMAKTFVKESTQGKDNPLLGYLQDGAVVNATGSMHKGLLNKMNEIGKEFYYAMGDMDEQAEEKMSEIMRKSTESMGKFGSFSWRSGGEVENFLDFVYAVELADKDKFENVIEEGMDLWDDMASDFYDSMGFETDFTIERGVDEYKGVSIDSALLAMKVKDANSPQAQMIEKMYGEGIAYKWAIVDDLFVCAVGGNTKKKVYELIDQVQSGTAGQLCSEVQSAFEIAPAAKTADFAGTLNYVRIFKLMMNFSPFPVSGLDVPTQSNVVFAGNVGSGKFKMDLFLPKQHLKELTTMSQMMQQQMMMNMQQQKNVPMQTSPEQ